MIREEVTIYQITKGIRTRGSPIGRQADREISAGKAVNRSRRKEEWKQHPANEKVWNPAAREFYMKYIEEDPTDGEPGTEETEPE